MLTWKLSREKERAPIHLHFISEMLIRNPCSLRQLRGTHARILQIRACDLNTNGYSTDTKRCDAIALTNRIYGV